MDIYAKLRASYPIQALLLLAVVVLDFLMTSHAARWLGVFGILYGIGLFFLSFVWLRMATQPYPRAQRLAILFLGLALLFYIGFQWR